MKRRIVASVWFQRALFLSACMFFMLLLLLPAGLSADSWFMPDLIYAVCVAWVIRRPDAAPFILIGLVGFLADILLGKPVGLWALLLMIGTEYLRQQGRTIRAFPFVVELLWVAGLLAVLLTLQAIMLAVTFAPNLSMSDTLIYFAETVLVYPLVVAVIRWGFGIHAPRVRPAARGFGNA